MRKICLGDERCEQQWAQSSLRICKSCCMPCCTSTVLHIRRNVSQKAMYNSINICMQCYCISISRRLIRFVWPIFMAVIEARKPADRDWLLAKLYEIRSISGEAQRSYAAAIEILARQEGDDRSIDLAKWIWRESTSPPQTPEDLVLL